MPLESHPAPTEIHYQLLCINLEHNWPQKQKSTITASPAIEVKLALLEMFLTEHVLVQENLMHMTDNTVECSGLASKL